MASLDIDIEFKRLNNGIKIENLKEYLQSLNDKILTVGVHADAGKENIKKMLWNEFGTNHRLKYDSVVIPGVGLKPLSRKTLSKAGYDNQIIDADADISIPARPVVRMYLYQDIKNEIGIEYQLAMNREKQTRLISPKISAEKTLNDLGQECVYMQRDKMANGNFSQIDNKGKNTESNSPLTVKVKGFDQPYFDTGELIGKISYKVKNNGK